MSDYNETHTKSIGYADYLGEDDLERANARIGQLRRVFDSFIKSFVSRETSVRLDEETLKVAVYDYFADVKRLKAFHGIERINDDKIIAYECFWLLRHKPIQLLCNDPNLVHINEFFVAEVILDHLVGDHSEAYEREELKQFYYQLLYHTIYRSYDPKTLELMIVAFKTARAIFEPSDKDSK